MMIDQDVVAVSPATVYRVLKKAGRLDRWNRSPSRKGTGFVQPLQAHEHWHVDISYINVAGTFFYLCSILDGYSRVIVHWDLRPSMTERDVECIVQRAREKFPDARPRIISDNGPQFIARDFKEFIRVTGMTHVRTSRNYPQSNGKLERWHKTLKSDAIRVKALADSDEARRVIAAFVGTPTACAFTARSDTWRRSTTWRVARTTSGLSPPVSLGTIFTNITGDQVPDHGRSGLRALELSLMSSMAGDRLCESPDVEVPSDRPAIYHLPHRGGVDHLGVAALGEQPSRKLAARPSNVSAPTGGLLGTGDPGDSGTLRRRR
jgi:transposase-like protein